MRRWDNDRLWRIAQRVAARRLSVFDFDDTLVSSQSSVSVEHGDGEVTVLDSASFAYFKGTAGDRIDFSDFNNVTRPRLIKKGMDALRKAAADESTRPVILTARPKGSASAVKKFMEKLGLNNVEVVALQSSDPMDKARWIEHEAGDAEEVSFMDDSSKNVEAVGTLKGKIKAKVDTINPPHPSDEDYEGETMGETFESDAPTAAKVEVKPKQEVKKQEGDKGQEQEQKKPDEKKQEPPSKTHQMSPWWRDQSPEFKQQYCKEHPESQYCRAARVARLAERMAGYSGGNWLGIVDGSGDAEVRKVTGTGNHNTLFGFARVLHSRNRFFFVPGQGTAYWISNPDEEEKDAAEGALAGYGVMSVRHSDWQHYRAASASSVAGITAPYAENQSLECDGLTRVLHTVLSDRHIPHTPMFGRVEWNDRHFMPHFWIELPNGEVVDYRLRMWFGPKAPNGVFDPKKVGVTYDGRRASMPLLTDLLFNVLSGRSREAGVREVIDKITKRVRDSELVHRLTEKVLRFVQTRNPSDDLTPEEVSAIYRQDDYGDDFDMPGGQELDVGWTNHAEYRSDLRNVDPSKVNEAIRDFAETHPNRHQKVNLMNRNLGKAVVDVNTMTDPEQAHVVTVMASESWQKYLAFTPESGGEYYTLEIPEGVEPPSEGDQFSLNGIPVQAFEVSSAADIAAGRGGPVANSMRERGIACRVNCLPMGHEWLRRMTASNDLKGQLIDRANKVKSAKVKKYVHGDFLRKIEQMGEAAGIWLETLESHFGRLKPKGLMEGWEDSDFDDLWFVITGQKRKKASDVILFPGQGDGNDEGDQTHHYRLGAERHPKPAGWSGKKTDDWYTKNGKFGVHFQCAHCGRRSYDGKSINPELHWDDCPKRGKR